MFLTPEQIEQLTGYRKPALQRQWLLVNDYRFDVRADGRPVVMIEQVRIRQLKDLRTKSRGTDEPDFAALDH